MNFPGSNYDILENRKTFTGELNSVIGSTMSNSLRVNYSSSDESRPQSDVLFPFVDILPGGAGYISFGSEPFTPNNELRYKSVRDQERLHQVRRPSTRSRSAAASSGTLGQRVLQLLQAGRVGLQQPGGVLRRRAGRPRQPEPDDVAGHARRYQLRYMNIPGLDKPRQPLTALYGGAYAQDVWRPRTNLSVTVGLRFDVPCSRTPPTTTPNANALTFRDETGAHSVRQRQDARRQHPVVAALRLQLRPQPAIENPAARRHRRIHRPAALRLDFEPAGQHRRVAGQLDDGRTPTRPF